MEGQTFREAFGVLQRHAETLREQTEPNIDDLLSIVTESVAAYKVCKQRIDAVEKALQAALTDVGGDIGRAAGAAASDDEDEAPVQRSGRGGAKRAAAKPRNEAPEAGDDEIPF